MGNEHGEWILFGAQAGDPGCLTTPEELLEYIDRIGFLPLFRNSVPGFSVEEHTLPGGWWSGDVKNDPWEWRGILAATGRVAYGKFFDRKAGFISLKWLPYFVNWRRDGYDFDARWEDAKAGRRHKKIMDLFAEGQSLFSYEIKAAAGFGKDGEKNFEGTVTDLQMQTYLCVRDFRQKLNKQGLPYGWNVGVLTAPETLWGYEAVTTAYSEEPEISKARIYEHLRAVCPTATDSQIDKILHFKA